MSKGTLSFACNTEKQNYCRTFGFMKRYYHQVLSLFLVISLFGCGSGTNSSVSSADSGNSSGKTVSYLTEDGRFEIIEVECTEHSKTQNHDAYVSVRIKVKNNTDQDFDYVEFSGQSYDKNEDNLNNIGFQLLDIDAGHSAWSSSPSGGTGLEDYGGFKLKNYEIADEKEGTLYRQEVVDFDKKNYINLDEMNIIKSDK